MKTLDRSFDRWLWALGHRTSGPYLLLVLGLTVAACSSGAPSPSTVPAVVAASPTRAASPSLAATGGYFAVSVADLHASETWYMEKLGLEVAMRPPTANGISVVVLRGDGLTVELIHQDKGVTLHDIAPAIDDRTLLHGIVKAGVIVDDLDATIAFLRARNVPIAFGPFPATAEQPANFIIADNEGNLIQFIDR